MDLPSPLITMSIMRYLMMPAAVVLTLNCWNPVRAANPDTKAIENALASGRLLEASRLYEELVSKYPLRADLHASYGRFLQSNGQMGLAQKELQRSLQLNANQPEACLALADIFLQSLDVHNALKYAETATKLDPASKQARLVYINALMQNGRGWQADVELNELMFSCKDPDVLHLAYQSKARKGDLAQARAYLQEAVKGRPEQTSWIIELSKLLESSGDYQSARSLLKDALQRNPNAVDARVRLARNMEVFENDYDGAISQYQSALQIDPDSSGALLGIDRCRAKKNDLARRLKLGLQGLFNHH